MDLKVLVELYENALFWGFALDFALIFGALGVCQACFRHYLVGCSLLPCECLFPFCRRRESEGLSRLPGFK